MWFGFETRLHMGLVLLEGVEGFALGKGGGCLFWRKQLHPLQG